MAVDPRKYALICVLLSAIFFTCQTSEQGKWSKALKVNGTLSYVAVYKTLFNNSDILLSITCGEKSEGKMEVNWMLRWSPCAEEYLEITNEQVFKVKSRPAEDFYFIEPNVGRFVGMKYLEVEYVWATPKTIDCTDKTKQFLDFKSNFTTANMFYADVTTTGLKKAALIGAFFRSSI